jgi:hypothetical protein
MAEVGMQAPTKRKCQREGCPHYIPSRRNAEGCPARRSSIPRNASKKRLQNAEGQHKPLGDVYNDTAQRSARKMGVFFNREETA